MLWVCGAAVACDTNFINIEMVDHAVVYEMHKNGHVSGKALMWIFFKQHFLLPTPTSNSNTQQLQQYMQQNGCTTKTKLADKEVKKHFINWIRAHWIPSIAYPKPMRGTPNNRGTRAQRLAVEFESKLYAYYKSLLGPDRALDVATTTLSLPNHLGLFCARTLKIHHNTSKDLAILWGDVHQVNCTDSQWENYKRAYSSCFEVPVEEKPIRKRFLLTGPVSLANHHCEEGMMVLRSGGKLRVVCGKKYEKNSEIFVHYGESYFKDEKCVCCK